MSIPIVTYEEVKDLPNHPEKYLIDVREPHELEETGRIPTSTNVPLASVATALAPDFDPSAFEAKYGRSKPALDTYIIFSCRSGRRSLMAAQTAVKLGYTNVKTYEGSWLDWAKREGL